MPKISQEELERERLTSAVEALRAKMREHLLQHPSEGPTHMLEIFKRIPMSALGVSSPPTRHEELGD